MRHLKSGRQLGRNSSHRKAMYRNMVTSLMVHGRIRTTEAKAKELRRVADRVINLGKTVPLSALEALEEAEVEAFKARRVHHIRRSRKWLQSREAVGLVFGELAERFQSRPGGYTRILKAGYRKGDNAPMAIIELVGALEPATETGPLADEVDVAAAPAGEE